MQTGTSVKPVGEAPKSKDTSNSTVRADTVNTLKPHQETELTGHHCLTKRDHEPKISMNKAKISLKNAQGINQALTDWISATS